MTTPVELVDRPREPRRRWRILTPAEVAAVRRAFGQLEQAAEPDARAWVAQAAAVFTTVYGTGIRRGEPLGLRWRHVRLADPEGPTLRVEETYVRNQHRDPRSPSGRARIIPLGPVVADALFEHRARTAYSGDGDRVFCHLLTGGPLDHKAYADTLREALAAAGITGHIRPFHDGRHTAITNAAAAGVGAAALQARAGHGDLATTQRYIDLAGVSFREEALIAEQRMFGVESGRNYPGLMQETAD